MPATYRLGDLRQRANLLHHEILQDEVGLRTLTDRLNAVAGMPDAKRKVEQRLATNRPRLASMESEIRRLEAAENLQRQSMTGKELADRMRVASGLGMSRRWDQGYVPGKGGKDVYVGTNPNRPPRRKASVDTRYFVAIGMGSPSEKARVAADRMAFPQEYGRTPMGPPRPSYNDDRLDKILVQGMNTGASRARVLHDMLADVVPLSRETNISVPDIRDYLRRRGVV